MTEREHRWDDPAWVQRWVERDAARSEVSTARQIAVEIVGLEGVPGTVLELAGGPGSFLAAFLRAYPAARGVWSDSSPLMAGHARQRLAAYADRVSFVLTDVRAPAVAPAPVVDVLVCARFTHTLPEPELELFYRRAAAALRPGGWLVNLDHVQVDRCWQPRYDQLIPRFYEGRPPDSGAPARAARPAHRLSTHLAALDSAGLADADVPWRLLSTALLLARRPGGRNTE